MRLTQLPEHQRPREKLLNQGAEALSDAELLAIFFRTGIKGLNAIELAQDILKHSDGLGALMRSSASQFCQYKGMGLAKYVQLQASIELSRRFLLSELHKSAVFTSADCVREFLMLALKAQQREQFCVLFLDAQNQLICFETLFKGTINAASVYPREVVKEALKHNAAAVIFAHNHPSGMGEPSEADKLITKKLVSALELVDIRVLDHMIVADAQCVSFAEMGLL